MVRDTKNKGITFIALIVTIVVLLIILSISLAILTGDNGIVKRTGEATETKNKSEEKEAVEWAAAQAIGDSDIGRMDPGKFKEFLDSYIGDGKNEGFEYEIDDNYKGIFVVEFKTSGNKYTIDSNGNVYEEEQPNRDGIEVSPSNATINVGETIKLTYTTEANKDKIKWSSENEGIAKVDQDGNVTGISNGNVTIIATTDKGKKSEAYITVQTKPTGIEVTPTEGTIDLSSASRFVQITAKILPETANVSTGITWTSSNENVATVTTTGLVTGKLNGTATITATTENGISATCKITVQTSPTGINLSTTNATLDLSYDPTMTLVAKSVSDTVNISSGITWTSSNPAIATVSGNGENAVVTGKSNGEVDIIATTENGKSMICKVTVQTSPLSVSLNKTSSILDLSGTKTVQLVATINPSTANVSTGLTWTSSNTSVATVSNNGLVTGVKNGTATITVETGNGKKATCNIVVETSITKLSISPASAEMQPGENLQLKAIIEPSTATEGVTWTSSNTSVATVDSNGLVTGKTNGTVTITVKSSSGSKVSTATIKCYTKYTITYDANGGTGAPGSQIKTHGTDLILSSTVPTRTGYSFQGWATGADGSGTVYAAGATLQDNANTTLYATWRQATRRILRQWNKDPGSCPTGWQMCGSVENLGGLVYIKSITGPNDRGVFIGAGAVTGTNTIGGRIQGYDGNQWVTLWEDTETLKATLFNADWAFWRPNISKQVNGWYSQIRCLSYYEKSGNPLGAPWMTFDFDLNF